MRKSLMIVVMAAAMGASATLAREPAGPGVPKDAGFQALSERYLALRLRVDPLSGYFAGFEMDHARLPDRSPEGIARIQEEEDRLLADLARISFDGLPAPDQPAYATMMEILQASRGLRVCKQPWWDVNHFIGWQQTLPHLAALQPVGSAEERAEALARWSSLPQFVAVEIDNLRRGMDAGYSAPRAVVERVVVQLDGLIAMPRDKSPFYAPATRAEDAAFRAEFDKLFDAAILPAIRSYRDYLVQDYAPRARDSLALSALPEGASCYAAMLRAATSLDRGPKEVFELGRETVAGNRQDIIEIGRKLFSTDDFKTIIARVNEGAGNGFRSAEELLAYSNQRLGEALDKTRPLFATMPQQPVIIEPMPEHQAASGMSAQYIPGADRASPGKYMIPLNHWQAETRAVADITLVHETVPGHHLQIALTYELPQSSPVAKLGENAVFVEGWARYAEMLAEEAGIYDSDHARITRRVWPARGMVVDPGLHMFGWSRAEAEAYLIDSGRFDAAQATALVDRMAALPGQLTSYDSGGLEIMALRREAEDALGDRFDIREFHQRVLERGVVPLLELRRHVRAWIQAQ